MSAGKHLANRPNDFVVDAACMQTWRTINDAQSKKNVRLNFVKIYHVLTNFNDINNFSRVIR